MLQFSFAAHDVLCLYKHILFTVNKSNSHFKGMSRIFTDSFNKINVNILQFSFKIFLEFILTNVGCNYELV